MNIRGFSKRPDRVRVVFEGEGRTRQSFTDECDINKIMAKYQKTGAISHFSRHSARYDFADDITFHEALNVVTEADRMFADLPSKLRERFREPGDFLSFVQDEANAEEMIELGLRDPVTPRERTVLEDVPKESEAAKAAAEASD